MHPSTCTPFDMHQRPQAIPSILQPLLLKRNNSNHFIKSLILVRASTLLALLSTVTYPLFIQNILEHQAAKPTMHRRFDADGKYILEIREPH
ncbi:hypothetical protein NA56DRAFT_496679 [Hyaloscypha hepaticicola]|uniref:Uncharacterized protein n=1 Tax=Hyaloscypha hepaticicola TaxID=2082293 RepID=A0A2J6QET7_9HELO|nr:hypothetical protein NA56DRAFT_496679 [Hyaloscypha hepaticicola]